MPKIISSFPTIYHDSKEWSIEVEEHTAVPANAGTSVWTSKDVRSESHYIIRTEHGKIGGALVIHEKIISEGKNIGRSNETSPKEQALKEAQRDFDKKLKSGYSIQSNQEQAASSGTQSFEIPSAFRSAVQRGGEGTVTIQPMLADKYDSTKMTLSYPVYIQPKLDGVRCLIYKNQVTGELVFQSRQNTPYTKPPLIERMIEQVFESYQSLYPKDSIMNLVLDGELYIHNRDFTEISSIVGTLRASKEQRIHPELNQLEYHMYDWFFLNSVESYAYTERYDRLQRVYSEVMRVYRGEKRVELVETRVASDPS